MTETPNHTYNTPEQGTEDWHVPLNENFDTLDTDVEIRDTEANRSDYEPTAGAKYEATDSGAVYHGDGTDWVLTDRTVGSLDADSQSFTDADVVVTPASHDFDDVVDELNAGKHVVGMPGTYAATDDPKDVTDGSLEFVEGARVDVPNDPPPGWLDIHGSTGASTAVTADLQAGEVEIPVADTSMFESGRPALLNDDGGYVTMDGRGEIVYVSEIVDGSTVVVRDELGLSHSTDDEVELQVVDPLTDANSWTGVTFDCRGVVQNSWPLVTRHHVDGHVMRDITFLNGDGSSMHQYMEVRESYNPKLVGSRNGRVNDGDLGLMWSPERQTRHAEMRNCTVYWGNVAEFGNNGSGPSQDARFVNVTVVGGAFSSNATVIRPQYVDCTVSNNHDATAGRAVAFLSDGVGARYVNCRVEGSFTGFELRGHDETITNCEVRRPEAAAVRFGSTGGGHPDAQTGTKRIRGLTVEDSRSSVIASIGSPGSLVASDVTARNSGDVLNLAGGPEFVRLDDALLRGGTGISTSGIDRLELRGLDVDCRSSLGTDWYRETSTNTLGHLLVEDSAFYGIDSGSAIRVADFGTLEVSSCRVPPGTSQVDDYLVRDEGDGSQVVLRGNDARNAGTASGYQLTTDGLVSDGTNLTSDGSAI